MIVKITKGSNFKGAELYDSGKTDIGKIARVLACEGLDMDYDSNGGFDPDLNKIAHSFNMQASMNPRVKYPVKHLAMSWPREDIPLLSDEKILECAKEYMELMGYRDTQYMITRHCEKENPHIHIIINTVNNYGQKIPDYNEYRRNIEVCRELTQKYGFTWGRCKWAHKSDIPCDSMNRAYEHARYDICVSVAQAMAQIKDIKQLPQRLALDGSGVSAAIKCDSGGKPVGISFTKTVTMEDGKSLTCKFNGSSLDRRFSCSNLQRILEIKDDFPLIDRAARQTLAIYDLSKRSYKIPRRVRRKCERLREELRHLYSDQKRLEKEYVGACYVGFYAVVGAIAYGTPLTMLVAFLASTLVAGLKKGQYERVIDEKEDKRRELRNLLTVFKPLPNLKYYASYDGHSHANGAPKEPKPSSDGPVVDDIMGGMRISLH